MKHWGWTAILFALAAGLSAQALDQPVATIKLDKKSSLVSQKTFRDRIAVLESQNGTKLDKTAKDAILDELVMAELIRMDMDAQGIKATDDDLMKQFRQSNPGLSDAQIRQSVESQSGKTWDDAVAPLKKQIASMKYFNQFPAFQELGKITVSDQEIQDFYQANQDKFAAPDYVRISHIFFDTKAKPNGTLAEIQKRAEDAQKKIASGQATFEEMATKVSEDSTSAKTNGDIGYLPRNLDSAIGQKLLSVFGQDFINNVFALKKGEVSGVLTSVSGLHIVRVTQKIDKHFMTLDEEIYPGQGTTVRQYINQFLGQRKVVSAQNKAVSDVGNDLKKKATIKTFEQNY